MGKQEVPKNPENKLWGSRKYLIIEFTVSGAKLLEAVKCFKVVILIGQLSGRAFASKLGGRKFEHRTMAMVVSAPSSLNVRYLEVRITSLFENILKTRGSCVTAGVGA